MNAAPVWLDRDLFPFTSRFVTVAGARVHYVDEGSGPVLLMLHGNPTWSFLWRRLIADLRRDFRCIALDYPGFGLSEAPAGYGFTPREHSAVVEAFVEALALRELTPVVHDWGGPIGLGLAGRRPDLIAGLVIANSFAWPARRSRGLSTFSRLVGSRAGRWLIVRHNALARWLIPAGTNRRLTPAELAGYLGPLATAERRLPGWVLAREIRASEDYLTEVEGGLAVLADRPALIVWGDGDGAFRAPDRERYARLFPRHEQAILPGARHFVPDNEPDAIAAAIRRWAR